jgi:ATP-dependent RNA helicase RhlE
VVNYELPNVPEDYVHRIGRTGRAGATGEAISLVCVDEHVYLRDIERLIKRDIPQEVVAGFEPDRNAKAQPILQRQGGGQHRNNGGQGQPRGKSGGGGRGQGHGRGAPQPAQSRSRHPNDATAKPHHGRPNQQPASTHHAKPAPAHHAAPAPAAKGNGHGHAAPAGAAKKRTFVYRSGGRSR